MRKVQHAEGEFYHLYNRGVDKRIVFQTREDYDRFQAYLFLLNDVESLRPANFFADDRKKEIFESARGEPLVAIGAYCLMPNHFHILVTPLVEEGIAKFMQKLQTAYTMYFNEKNSRSGSLFQGTYKSKQVSEDNHLKYLFAYIHLNPAKLFTRDWRDASASEFLSMEKKIMTYTYSSAGEYMLSNYVITTPKHFPKYFPRSKDMEAHLNFWLKHKKSAASPES